METDHERKNVFADENVSTVPAVHIRNVLILWIGD